MSNEFRTEIGRRNRRKMPKEAEEGERCIWILGLLHSGTTVFWRAWRKDNRFICFDEPFLPLADLPSDNVKGTRAELIRLLMQETDPRVFWKYHSPLHPMEELETSFTENQVDYLRYLLAQASRVVIDETHLHLHLPHLAELTPHAHVIHLYRRARGFATSHLRPSWSRDTNWWRLGIRRLRREYQKRVFWTRDDYPPGMRRNDVIGRHPLSKFGLMLTDAGYDTDEIMAAPAVVRLMAYWRYHYHYLEREGPRLFGDRFTSVRYEDFANDPEGVMGCLYDWVGLPQPEPLMYSQVHPPKPAFRRNDRRWLTAARAAGFQDEELEALL